MFWKSALALRHYLRSPRFSATTLGYPEGTWETIAKHSPDRTRYLCVLRIS
jgi:hypothetical protein